MISFWERSSWTKSDVLIIGGGITGLSTAISLKERQPDLGVTVLERSVIPYGASTRNAGFACFGSLTELLADIEKMGEHQARELLFQRWMGLQITRKRLGDKAIGFEENGGFELLSDPLRLEAIPELNALLGDFMSDYFGDANDLKRDLGIQQDGSLVQMSGEGQVDTGKLMRTLYQCAAEKGVLISNGAEAIDFAKTANGFEVIVKDQSRKQVTFAAEQLVLANNAFASQLAKSINVVPGRGQVMISKPINGLSFRGNLHMDEGYHYLRNVGSRLLFGGGRNLDPVGEETYDMELNSTIQSDLDHRLHQLFGDDFTWQLDMRWSGIMGFSENKLPIVEKDEDGVWSIVALSGMGIALAGYLGEELAEQLI